jgi:hypothetical protein
MVKCELIQNQYNYKLKIQETTITINIKYFDSFHDRLSDKTNNNVTISIIIWQLLQCT